MKSRTARSFLLLAVALPFVVGCGNSANKKLIGQWEGKLEFDEDPAKSNPAMQLQKIMAAGMSMEFDFKSDNTFVMNMGMLGKMRAQTQSGKWNVAKQVGNEVTLNLSNAQGDQEETMLTFEGDDSFIMATPDSEEGMKGATFRFTRKPQ